MSFKRVGSFAFLAASLFFAGDSSAAVVVTENFDYPDGPLVPNGGWVNQSGTAGTLLVASGEAVVTQDNSSPEDTELVFANNLTTGLVTADFTIRVTVPDPMVGITGTDFEYFAHFSDDTTFNFQSRLDIIAPTTLMGDYTLGLAAVSSTNEVFIPVDFNFGDTVPVSLTFDLDTGTASVTAGGFTVASPTLVPGEIIDAFNLRQSSSSSDETIFIDNLVISASAIPEPASLSFLGVLACGCSLVRRRRS